MTEEAGRTEAPRATIRVGVAGWDYPDWRGRVYPTPSPHGFDRLAYLSRFVDVLEIDTSFYRPVAARVAGSWVRRTADRTGFRFTAKAYRGITHDAPDDLASAVAPSLRGLEPIRDAGRLGAILLQYPQSFHRSAAAVERLRRTLDALQGWPVVVEVRHVSWDTNAAEDWLKESGAGWCVVDQPQIGRSTAPPTARITAPVAYLRLHGRNAADWFREGAGRNIRYDYLYSSAEVGTLAELARSLARGAAEVYVVQNNHFRGKALVNALQLQHLLTGVKSSAPESLVTAYPELAESVVPVDRRPTLF